MLEVSLFVRLCVPSVCMSGHRDGRGIINLTLLDYFSLKVTNIFNSLYTNCDIYFSFLIEFQSQHSKDVWNMRKSLSSNQQNVRDFREVKQLHTMMMTETLLVTRLSSYAILYAVHGYITPSIRSSRLSGLPVCQYWVSVSTRAEHSPSEREQRIVKSLTAVTNTLIQTKW